MVNYKLIYFNSRGRAETARLIFHYAKVPFEDVRLTPEEWAKFKQDTPFGQLPVLEEDGKQLAQSYAIFRYLATKYGLAGKDDFESAYLDSIADFQKDAASDFRPYMAVAMGFVEGDKEKLYKDCLLPAVDKHFPTLVELLKKSGTGFFGSSVSWVDFMIAEGLNTFYGMNPEIFEKYQELVALIKRVHNLPEIKEYVETRPKTSR